MTDGEARLILVARPQPGVDATAAVLERAGYRVLRAPVLQVRAMALTAAARQRVLDLDRYAVLVFTSEAAVRHGLEWIDQHWPQYPVKLQWFAVGARTRGALEARAIAARSPQQDETTEGLLALPELQDMKGLRVLIVKGVGGREMLAEVLTERGARVDTLQAYERVPVAVALPGAEVPWAAMVSSNDVLDALLAALSPLRHEPLVEALFERPLLVPSTRVAEHARHAGFADVHEIDGAGPEATLSGLRTLQQSSSYRGAPD